MQGIIVGGLTDTNATVIAYDDDGNVVDFVHIEPDSDIQSILFQAPVDGSELFVVVIGPSRSQELFKVSVVSSSVGEGMLGEVTVGVTDGIGTGIFGNGISPHCSLGADDLEKVRDQLVDGSHEPSDRVRIIRK